MIQKIKAHREFLVAVAVSSAFFIALFRVDLPFFSGKDNDAQKFLASITDVGADALKCGAMIDGAADNGAYEKITAYFELNKGQDKDQETRYLFKNECYKLSISSDGFKIYVPDPQQSSGFSEPVSVIFEEAGQGSSLEGANALSGKANYFRTGDSQNWVTGIPLYKEVVHKNVYPNIDVLYYGNHRKIEYDFIVSPGGNPEDILLGFGNVKSVRIDSNGNLVFETSAGQFGATKPIAYQNINNVRREVAAGYVITGDSKVKIEVGEYDESQALVIDPVLVYSTYLASAALQLNDITIDFFGNVYVTGLQNRDVFVSKIDSSGALVYFSLIGSSAEDRGTGIAIDSSGNAYVTGDTGFPESSSPSFDFPTVNPIQSSFSGGDQDAFVLKLNSDGSTLLYSTYFGGSGGDGGEDIIVDSKDNIYITGFTISSNFPTASPYQAANGGGQDAFVAKISSAGTLTYSTYLGGKGADGGRGLAVDSSGAIYLTGTTSSSDFPTTVGTIQLVLAGNDDAFVTKLNAAGDSLAYSTYLGGSSNELANSVGVDSGGNAYITGFTDSSNFPTLVPLHDTFRGIRDGFVAKINSTGLALSYSTYLGGDSLDEGRDIFIDKGSGTAYVTGITYSDNFPTANPLQASKASGFPDAFISKINADGSAYYYASYLGGSGNESGLGINANSLGEAFFVGVTDSKDFPLVNPIATAGNIFVVRVDIADILEVDTKTVDSGLSVIASVTPKSSGTSGVAVNLTNNSAKGDTDTIQVARFASNPGTANVIDFGGGFMDIKTLDVEAEDSLTSDFYYSSEIKDLDEIALATSYFDGVNWLPVLSSGGVPPTKDTTDNIDSTISGGKFIVVFDNSSTPKITDLTGTAIVFVQGDSSVAIQDIIDKVGSLGLKKGDEKRLISPLEKIQKELEKDKKDKKKDDKKDKNKGHSAVKELEKFVKEVEKMSGKGLKTEDASLLINLAEIVMEEIN